MNCSCDQLPSYVELWDDVESFDAFAVVDQRYDVELRRCPTCGVHWQIDIGRGNLAIRIVALDTWTDFDDRSVRLAHMVAFHGGHDAGVCTYAGCDRPRLIAMAICEHHAYPMLSNEMDT